LLISRALVGFSQPPAFTCRDQVYGTVSNRSGRKELSSGGFHDYDFEKA
jgi:hypothetical protein